MATVRITRHELDAEALPAICVVTGKPTTRTVRHTFQWALPSTSWAFLGGFAMYGVVRAQLRKDFTFRVPIASRRRGHWL